MKVRTRTDKTNKFSYPDVVVTCGDELYEDENGDVLLNPLVIIEVLSASTEAYDRGLKFFHYQLIPSLQEYREQFTQHCGFTFVSIAWHIFVLSVPSCLNQ